MRNQILKILIALISLIFYTKFHLLIRNFIHSAILYETEDVEVLEMDAINAESLLVLYIFDSIMIS